METRQALADLKELRVSPRITIAYLGLLDLLTSLGLPQSAVTPGNPLVEHLMARFLIDARLAGITPLSFVYQDHRDLEGFNAWCKKAKAMGYPGSGCISPAQVEIANRVFAPDKAQQQRAHEIVSLFEQAQREGVSGFDHPQYGFIDEPIYRDALLSLDDN